MGVNQLDRAIAALSSEDRELYEAARAVSNRAYAPYSLLKVGAAIRTELGGLFLGCNVENASFGLTSCAERNAVFAAIAVEGPEMRIRDVAVSADAHMVSPCGACRQVLAEFGPEARVLFPAGDQVLVTSMTELLPLPFELRG